MHSTCHNPTFPPSALRHALLLAAALLAAPGFAATHAAVEAKPGAHQAAPANAVKKTTKAKATAAAAAPAKVSARKTSRKPVAAASKPVDEQKPGPLANFGKTPASADVVHVANWISYTHNNSKRAFILIDKKDARMYVFDPHGKLKSRTAVLLGKAVGDNSAPGIGDKPISQITEDEKTTPAGRFLAQPGRNTGGDDIIWIDYSAAISMHRMRKVSAQEHRADRMATPDPGDNRISYGCVNVPHNFFNTVLKPTVMKNGAFVYVLPETRSPQQQFGSFDVTQKVAQSRGNSAGG
jgi:lipoprotein-anchoring transpeptidase ErfK/SrfK